LTLALFCVDLIFGIIRVIVFDIVIGRINKEIFEMIQAIQPSIVMTIAPLFE
jgi:hypothetical protein